MYYVKTFTSTESYGQFLHDHYYIEITSVNVVGNPDNYIIILTYKPGNPLM